MKDKKRGWRGGGPRLKTKQSSDCGAVGSCEKKGQAAWAHLPSSHHPALGQAPWEIKTSGRLVYAHRDRETGLYPQKHKLQSKPRIQAL